MLVREGEGKRGGGAAKDSNSTGRLGQACRLNTDASVT